MGEIEAEVTEGGCDLSPASSTAFDIDKVSPTFEGPWFLCHQYLEQD